MSRADLLAATPAFALSVGGDHNLHQNGDGPQIPLSSRLVAFGGRRSEVGWMGGMVGY